MTHSVRHTNNLIIYSDITAKMLLSHICLAANFVFPKYTIYLRII
jgi:hypothetical protein